MQGFIYKVTNKINGKIYIGQTIQSVKDRWYRHCGKTGLSKGEMNMAVKRAILKYGKENFIVETIETCDQNLLNERERYYIQLYNSYKDGYNCTIGGQDGVKPPKTTEKQASEIIELYKAGFTLKEIGTEYHIDKATVKGVLVRHKVKLRKKFVKFSQEDKQKMLDEYRNGLSRKEIMSKYNVSKAYLSQLITGKRRI